MIKWKTDVYKDIKNFDEFSFPQLIDLYKKQYKLLLDDGYRRTTDQEPLKWNIHQNGKKIKFNKIGLSKKSDVHLSKYSRNNITLDFANKTFWRDIWDNGSFIFIKIPNEVILNLTSHLHQPNLEVINKFFQEVDWDGDWESLMNDYDKRYPQKHKTNKPSEFSWRANFALVWWFSMRNEGIINPLVNNGDEILWARGSHRCFMLGKLGYDFPIFVYKKGDRFKIPTANYFFNNESMELLFDVPNKTLEVYHRENLLKKYKYD